MSEQKIPENLNIRFDEKSGEDVSTQDQRQHAEVGWSSLYGRVGDNITFHCYQGDTTWTRMWNWVWKDLGSVFVGLFRLFSFRSK